MKQFYISIVVVAFSLTMANAQCTTPVLSNVATPDAICSGETATLTAQTDSGTVIWYDSQSGGTELFSGDEYETNPLTSTTSFWVEGNNGFVNGAPISGGGKVAPTSTGGSSVVAGTSPWGLMFNATQDFVLNSVDVFLTTATPGTIVLNLKDNNLNVIQSFSVAAPAGGTGANPVQFTVPLGVTIPTGDGYRLVVVSNPAMIRDLGTNSFPYPIGTVGTITQGTINNANTNAGVYYFLYNWNVSPLMLCASDRQEVVVTVNQTPAPDGDAVQTFSAGETIANLDVTGENLSWFSDANGTNPIPTTTPLQNGVTYYVNQTIDGCTGEMLAVTANDPLKAFAATFSDLSYFPNPVKNKLHISNNFQIENIEVYNIQGQLITTKNVQNKDLEIDFDHYLSGVYIVKMFCEQSTKTIKVTKI